MHPSNKVTVENLHDVIYWHKPSTDQILRMEQIARQCEAMMGCILNSCPDCADRATALRAVREARMWSNASIALEPNSPIDHTRGA